MNASRPPFVPAYRTILAGLGLDAIDPRLEQTLVDTTFLIFLLEEFARMLPFDAEFYSSAYPDLTVDSTGELNLEHHFISEGYRKGRLPYAPAFHAATYLRRNPDLEGLHADTGDEGLRSHFISSGWQEGRTAHPAAEADATRWWRALRKTPYRLAHRSIASAAVQAFDPPAVAGPPLGFRGGPLLTDGPLDMRLRHRRGRQVVDSFRPQASQATHLVGEYVYGGTCSDHFGHAMAETIHRILPARAIFNCKRLLFVGERTDGFSAGQLRPNSAVGGFDSLPAAMRAPLQYLDVDPADVTVIREDCIVGTLHIVEQGSTLLGGPKQPYIDMLNSYTAQRLGNPSKVRETARLYVSRSRLKGGGTILGERYLENGLSTEGWRVIYPEQMDFEAQLSAYYSAEIIVFAEGSAVHGTELLPALGDCLLLPRRNRGAWWIEAALRPRARSLSILPRSRPLGSMWVDPATGSEVEHLGVALMDFPGVLIELRARGLAELQGLTLSGYRDAALIDLDTYLSSHIVQREGPQSPKPLGKPEKAKFQARCLDAIG